MTFSAIDWIIFVSVPLIAWFIGRSKRQTGSWRGYFLAQGNLSTTGVAATYFGANLTFTSIFLILSEEAYRRGFWVFSVPVCWMLGTVLFIKVYPKMYPYVKDGVTLHQALGQAFNSPTIQRWASVWTILAFIGTVSLEFYGGIRLLQWIGLPVLTSFSVALLLALIVSAFTVSGGFRGVSFADRWLDIVSLLGVGILLYYIFSAYHSYIFIDASSSIQKIIASESRIDPNTNILDNILFVMGMIVIFLPFQICTLDSWQRLGAWKERHNEKPTGWLLTSAIGLAIAYCVPILLGIVVRNQGVPIEANSHPLKVFLDMLHLGTPILGIIFAGFIAAIFSTADELLNCCSLSWLFDTLKIPRSNETRSEADEAKLVLSGKFYTAVAAFISALIALLALLFERQISELALAVFSGQVVFALPLLAGFYRPNIAPKLSLTVWVVMLISFIISVGIVVLGWVVRDKQITDSAPVVAFIVAGAILCIAYLLKKDRPHSIEVTQDESN